MYFDGKKVFNYYDDDYDFDNKVYELKEDKLFNIGISDEDPPAKTTYCKKCGGNEFNVGKATYWTGIKCVKCGWEICVHEG